MSLTFNQSKNEDDNETFKNLKERFKAFDPYKTFENYYPKHPLLGEDFNRISHKFMHDYPDQNPESLSPILIVPGFVTSALEIWKHKPCLKQYYFRKKIWGSAQFRNDLMFDYNCWIEHLMLDPITGLDPDGVKVRSDEGLGAVDQVTDQYWVQSNLIEELSIVGQDNTNLDVATWDWRLSFDNLQKRDRFQEKLKMKIESMYKFNGGRKIILLTHSLGSVLNLYFFDQLKRNNELNQQKSMIKNWVNVAGPIKGMAKTQAALISGEMRDTVNLGYAGNFVLDSLFGSKNQRKMILSTYGSLFHTLPSSINKQIENFVYGAINLNLENSDVKMKELMGNDWFNQQKNTRLINFDDQDSSNFEDVKIYSFQGYNYETEVGFIQKEREENEDPSTTTQQYINSKSTVEELGGLKVKNGVIVDLGDETIEIESLDGLRQWKEEGLEVVTRQIEGMDANYQFRSDRSSKHVDILGNLQFIQNILQLAAGGELEDQILL